MHDRVLSYHVLPMHVTREWAVLYFSGHGTFPCREGFGKSERQSAAGSFKDQGARKTINVQTKEREPMSKGEQIIATSAESPCRGFHEAFLPVFSRLRLESAQRQVQPP
jgi:hypothetical protein